MMRTMLRVSVMLGVWLGVAAALWGFVLPWAHVEAKYRKAAQTINQAMTGTPLQDLAGRLATRANRVVVKVKRGTEVVTGELPDLAKVPDEVSGAQIPQLANRRDTKVVLALAELLTGERELGAKSYAVYLVPGLVLVFGVALTLANQHRLLCGLIGLISLAVGGGGFWKLLTTETDTLLVGITIGRGLWMSLWAYVGLGVLALALILLARPRHASASD